MKVIATQSRVSPSWIFSAPQDFLFFFGTLLVGIIFGLYIENTGIVDTYQKTIVYLILVNILLDEGHVYATLFRTFFDKVEMKRRGHLIIGSLIGVALVHLILILISYKLFTHVLAYVALYHVVRQQIGFVHITFLKDPNKEVEDRKWDRGIIYLMTIACALYWFSHFEQTGKDFYFTKGDVFAIPSFIGDVAIKLMWCGVIAYFIREVGKFRKYGQLNIAKYIVVSTTFIHWYLGLVATHYLFLFVAMTYFYHSIPYIALVYKYSARETGSLTQLRWTKIFGPLKWVPFVLVFFLGSYIEYNGWFQVIPEAFAHIFVVPLFTMSEATQNIFIGFMWVPLVTHYVIDGFIWKFSDPKSNLKSNLGIS
jgi:hypothetical protein